MSLNTAMKMIRFSNSSCFCPPLATFIWISLRISTVVSSFLHQFFDMVFGLWKIERKRLQENIKKLMMSDKRRRWFHSSRVKLPFFNKSATGLLVSTYLTWILGFKLTLSNKQSHATPVGSGYVSRCRPSAFLWSSWPQLHCLQHYKSSKWECFALVTTWSILDSSSTSRSPWLSGLVLRFVLWISLRARLAAHLIIDLFFSTVMSHCLMGVLRRMQYFYHHIP